MHQNGLRCRATAEILSPTHQQPRFIVTLRTMFCKLLAACRFCFIIFRLRGICIGDGIFFGAANVFSTATNHDDIIGNCNKQTDL